MLCCLINNSFLILSLCPWEIPSNVLLTWVTHIHTLDAFTSHLEPPLWLTVYPRVVTSSCYLKKTHSTHWATDNCKKRPFDLSTLEKTHTQSCTHILTITRRRPQTFCTDICIWECGHGTSQDGSVLLVEACGVSCSLSPEVSGRF